MTELDSDRFAIQVSGLRKSFGRTSVLNGVDLQVPWGDVLTILGPNGSGKTTLIKILSTFTKADSGVARVAGLDMKRHGRSVRRNIGVVTHDTLLYENLTGRENLKFFARMFGLDRIDARIAHVIELMGVTSRLDDKIGTLSHGMKKRFSIARSLLHDPLILMMDEPESGLDQEALSMLDAVVGDKTNPHRTVLMTTHSLERGIALGNRMAILSRGKIAFHESLDECARNDVERIYHDYTRMAT